MTSATSAMQPRSGKGGRKKLAWLAGGVAVAACLLGVGGAIALLSGDDDTKPPVRSAPKPTDEATPETDATPDTTDTPDPKPTMTEPEGAIAEGYLGAWEGSVVDEDGESQDIFRRIEIIQGAVGSTIGTTWNLHPNSLCVGTAELVSFENLMVIESEITEEVGSSCYAYGEQTLRRQDADTLIWTYPSEGLRAELTRAPEADKDAVPERMEGLWVFDDDEERSTRAEIFQAAPGETAMLWTAESDSYYCEWELRVLTTAPDGQAVVLTPAESVYSEPEGADACADGYAFNAVLVDDEEAETVLLSVLEEDYYKDIDETPLRLFRVA